MVFNEREAAQPDDPMQIPCGKCIGCRLERSRQWAMRCVHEASLYPDNCFITLTYDNDHLPEDLSLNKKHLQNFWKELRKDGHKFRYFACGEYGDKTNRPHYHACMFNFDFADKKLWKIANGNRLYNSDYLHSKWRKGYCVIGDVTFESAAYVARYIMKKIDGKTAEETGHYNFVDDHTGEIFPVEPEFTTMSRRPGIAKEWFEKYYKDCYPKDYVTVNGVQMKPPKFYDRLFEEVHPYDMEAIKENRLEFAKENTYENSADRLRVREKVKKLQTQKLIRPEQ